MRYTHGRLNRETGEITPLAEAAAVAEQYERGRLDGGIEWMRRRPAANDRHARRLARPGGLSRLHRAYYLGWARGFRSAGVAKLVPSGHSPWLHRASDD